MSRSVRLSAELRASEGLSRADFEGLVSLGALCRVRRGVLGKTDPLSPDELHLRLARAVALQRQEPVFSHATAAVAWGLPVDRDLLTKVWVTRTSGHQQRVRDVRECEGRLGVDERARAQGLVVTTAARTVVDLARLSSLEWGVAAADAALNTGLCTRDDLTAQVSNARRRHGVRRAARAVEFADPTSESPLESISRVTISRTSLPPPILQVPIVLGGRTIARGDFGWPDHRVIGECDGAAKYGALLAPGRTTQDAVMAEKKREDRIREAGWWLVRWDWSLAWQPDLLERRIGAALGWASSVPRAKATSLAVGA